MVGNDYISYRDMSCDQLWELLNAETDEDTYYDIASVIEQNFEQEVPGFDGGRNENVSWMMFDETPDDTTGMDPDHIDSVYGDDPYISYPEV